MKVSYKGRFSIPKLAFFSIEWKNLSNIHQQNLWKYFFNKIFFYNSNPVSIWERSHFPSQHKLCLLKNKRTNIEGFSHPGAAGRYVAYLDITLWNHKLYPQYIFFWIKIWKLPTFLSFFLGTRFLGSSNFLDSDIHGYILMQKIRKNLLPDTRNSTGTISGIFHYLTTYIIFCYPHPVFEIKKKCSKCSDYFSPVNIIPNIWWVLKCTLWSKSYIIIR